MTEEDAETMIKALLKRINEKDQILNDKESEIGRLKAVLEIKDAAIQGLMEACADRDKLIIELANALDSWSQHSPTTWALIQRARDKTK